MMEKINLDNYEPILTFGHTSKGDQRKWKINDFWYKADYMGYESLSEVLISALLQKSKINYSFVRYQFVQIEYKKEYLQGCSSQNFLSEDEVLIPLEKLYRQYTGESLAVKLAEFMEISERIKFLVDTVQQITKIQDFGSYLTTILEIDAFFLNEDRHTNNIAVLYNESTKKYSLCPIFDQGLCLLADTRQDYPLGSDIEDCIQKIQAKPFDIDFDIQLDEAEKLYGVQLQFDFDIKDVKKELDQLEGFYLKEVRERVEELIRRQIRKYRYFMR